jgi:DNA-binding MarR family transcriptional regulator
MTERFGTEDAPQDLGGAPPATAEDNFEEHVWEISHLDTLVHQPKRLSILAALEPHGELNFPMLRRITGVTEGNLSTHLLRLEEAGLVKLQKRFVERKPETTAALTDEGRAAIEGYLEQTESILSRWRKRRSKKR